MPSKRFKSITGHHRHYEDEGLGEENERETDDDSFYGALEPHPQDGGNPGFFEDDDER